jgi:hypothetical protein
MYDLFKMTSFFLKVMLESSLQPSKDEMKSVFLVRLHNLPWK